MATQPGDADTTIQPAPVDADQGRAQLLATPSAENLLRLHTLLASEPHVAGTPGDARTIERLVNEFQEMGLAVETFEFWPYLAKPLGATLEVMTPDKVSLDLRERALPEDPASAAPEIAFGWNAYSGSGDVTAEVVYANYGTKADFEKLATLGVDVTGKVVLARYGGNYRGFKAKFAEQAGAVGLIIYTDPGDSGYMKGLTYPEGGFANDCCIQRGSIVTLGYQGDPLTPGVAATKDAPRLDPGAVDLPRIPVQPVGWGAAKEIMSRMTGAAVPEGWQGGLPFTYRVDGGPGLTVRLVVRQERAITKTANVIATLRGAVHPDKMVIVGCHHDAWNNGAADPTCGTIALLECARAFARQSAAGRPPDRTIVFAAWGAEEFGIIGSSEWVEAHRQDLVDNAIAYINLDMASMGLDFGSSASPSLKSAIALSAGAVPQPGAEGKTVLESWTARGGDSGDTWHGSFGDLGGGSDHVGFLCHAGVPSCSMGGGGSKGTSYHSAYDTLPWYWKVVGSDYASALMVTRVTTAMVDRLANSPLLPLDPTRYAADMARHLDVLGKRAATAGISGSDAAGSPLFSGLRAAAAAFEARSQTTMERVAHAVTEGRLSAEQIDRVNDRLRDIDRAWVDEAGIPGRPWFKSLFAAPDEDSGYAAWMLPALCWAIERRDPASLEREQQRYLAVLERMTSIITEIERELTAQP